MPTQEETAAYVGAGALGLAWLWLMFGGKKKRKAPPFYVPGSLIETYQGAQVVLRLPAGRYQSLSPLITIMADSEAGVATDLVVLIGSAPQAYTENLLIVDEDDPRRQYEFTVVARRQS